MKIVIAGGTGFLGKALIEHFSSKGHHLFVLSRSHREGNNQVQYLQWDGQSLGSWSSAIDGADVVINLTGSTINCRHTEKNKKEIVASRVRATLAIGQAIKVASNQPSIWINASGADIYKDDLESPSDEYKHSIGDYFSAIVSKQWEFAFKSFAHLSSRQVYLRITMILGTGGGVYHVFKRLSNFGLAGTQGSGEQMVSWMHVEDFCRAVEWIIDHQEITGAVNLAAPDPVPNKIFMKELRKSLNKIVGLPAWAWMIKIGTRLIGSEADLVLRSRNVVSKKLPESGFIFKYPTLVQALKQLAT